MQQISEAYNFRLKDEVELFRGFLGDRFVGEHPGGYRSGGRSMIVDPWGVVLAQASDGVGYIVAELDLEHQRELRAQLPVLANRRPEAYRWREEHSPVRPQGAAL